MFITRYWLFVLLLYGCWACSSGTAPKVQRVLTDSTFYAVFKQVPEMKASRIIDKKQLRDYNLRPKSIRCDSSFIYRHICEYDNYCDPCEGCHRPYDLLQKKQLNDSIYLLVVGQKDFMPTIPKVDIDQHESKIILLSYNVNRSEKPIDRLMLYSKRMGQSEMMAFINKDFTIRTTQCYSYRDCQKRHPDDMADFTSIDILVKNYNILPNGHFDLRAYMKGSEIGLYVAEGYYHPSTLNTHFKLDDSSDVYVSEFWQYSYDPKTKKKVKKGMVETHLQYEKFTARLTRQGELIVTDSVRRYR